MSELRCSCGCLVNSHMLDMAYWAVAHARADLEIAK